MAVPAEPWTNSFFLNTYGQVWNRTAQLVAEAFLPTQDDNQPHANLFISREATDVAEMLPVGCDEMAERSEHNLYHEEMWELQTIWDRKGFCDQNKRTRIFCSNQQFHWQLFCETTVRHFPSLTLYFSFCRDRKTYCQQKERKYFDYARVRGANKHAEGLGWLLSSVPQHRHTSGQ